MAVGALGHAHFHHPALGKQRHRGALVEHLLPAKPRLDIEHDALGIALLLRRKSHGIERLLNQQRLFAGQQHDGRQWLGELGGELMGLECRHDRIIAGRALEKIQQGIRQRIRRIEVQHVAGIGDDGGAVIFEAATPAAGFFGVDGLGKCGGAAVDE